MLTYLQIRDFAIIDAIELELRPGLTVLTGETGAGKSILVDALQLLAGGRAGAEVVRQGPSVPSCPPRSISRRVRTTCAAGSTNNRSAAAPWSFPYGARWRRTAARAPT
jgi:energy-coupling factor transporter ATP-binding protein EcfA2